jgi:beta-galactosidase
MAQIKGMGANFVRLAHYPQDPEVYRAADSLGILLWDEVPWNRGGVGGDEFKANTRRLMREMIRQNFNHPSIILWSVGNEVGDVPDEGRADPEAINGFISELNAIAHQLDPDRLTSMRKHNEGAHLVDVYSPSIWAGWYSGVYTNYEKAINDARARFPRLVHTEYGADGHVGRHTENPITGAGVLAEGWEEAVGQVQVNNIAQNGDWSESYQTDLLDWHLMVSERQPWFAGNAQWVFKDFATPLRPENPIPYMNQKGLVDRAGVPKDAYYVFRSRWTDNSDFAYIVSHTWTERSGPAGRPRKVRVYSNCARVELSVNGAGQGVRARDPNAFPAQGLVWDVTFAEGANRLEARCPAAPAVRDTLTVRYSHTQAGAPNRLELTSRPLPNGNLLVEAVMVDTAGHRLLNFSERVYFAHDGGGELLVHHGTPTRSRVIEAANGRAAIELVPPRRGERAVMEARTQDFKGIHLIIEGTR